ncbi:MAG: hypothetical protein M0Z88_03075 [Actinomycetota bacterium]|nr:hypothetical protein [Actinomycetota bacterium]MDA8398327.1 hypothetical protein [Actinomycetota bacterium]
MPDAELAAIRVRPIMAGERVRFGAEVAEHHWPGSALVGESMR